MLLFDPIFLIIISFGIWTSYTDIKFGKIKNVSIILLLFSGLVVNIFFSKTLVNSMSQTFINSGIALLVGFLMWNFGFWSAGDAKLFFVFSFLVPITIYKKGWVSYFPSYIILVNTFVPIAIFFLLYSIAKIDWKFLKKELKKMFSPSSISNMILILLGISSLFKIIYKFLNFEINLVFQIVFMFMFFEILKKAKKYYLKVLCIIFIVIGAIVSPGTTFTLSFAKNFLTTFLIFQGLRLLLMYLNEFSFTEEIKIKDLKQRMSLGENIVKKDKKYVKEHISLITHFDILRYIKKNISAEFSGKLTKDDIKSLQKLQRQKKLEFSDVKITKTVPFAPFMFLGVLSVYILKGNMMLYMIIVEAKILLYIKIFFYNLMLKFGL